MSARACMGVGKRGVPAGMYVNHNIKSQNITHSIMSNAGTTAELFAVYCPIFMALGNE